MLGMTRKDEWATVNNHVTAFPGRREEDHRNM
jgi:hypothetical protein